MNREWMISKNRTEKILLSGGFIYLKELNEFPDGDEKNKVLEKIEIAKQNHHPDKYYGKNGSRFSDKFLKKIGGFPIFYPLEWMSDFILLEHKTKIDNNDSKFLSTFSELIKSSDLYYIFMYMKPEILGLCAYTVMNVKDEDVFDSALEILDLYQKYYMACITNNKKELNKQGDEHKKWLKSIETNG